MAPGASVLSVRHPSLLSRNVTVCGTVPVFLNSTIFPTAALDDAGSKTRLSVAWMVIVAVPANSLRRNHYTGPSQSGRPPAGRCHKRTSRSRHTLPSRLQACADESGASQTDLKGWVRRDASLLTGVPRRCDPRQVPRHGPGPRTGA